MSRCACLQHTDRVPRYHWVLQTDPKTVSDTGWYWKIDYEKSIKHAQRK